MSLNSLFNLPSWAQQGQRRYIDPFNDPNFRPQEAGSGSATVGTGTGQGFYSGLGQDLFDTYSIGEGEMGQRINFDRLNQFLGDRRLVEIGGGPDNRAVRFMEGADGSVQGPVDEFTYTDNAFRNAALAAMAVTGANIGAAMGNGFVPGAGGGGGELSGLWGGEALSPMTPGAAPAAPSLGVDYSLATSPQAQSGGVLGGTSNGIPGGVGEGLQALPGTGTDLALPTGTNQGIGVMNPVTGVMGPTLQQTAGFAPQVGAALPAVGQSMLPPSMQSPTASVTAPTTPSPNSTGTRTPSGTGSPQWQNTLGSILGMYNANRDREDYQSLLDKMDQLYRPDSPYAQQMRDELERRDSAGGRASQYGPRATELAAKLTDSRRQALQGMTLPLSAMMMSRNQLANNVNNAITSPDGNVIDGAKQVFDWGRGAWDWFNKSFPDIFKDTPGG